MKHIYFVRHGESDANVNRLLSQPDTPLSEKGREQAGKIGSHCEPLHVDIILSSDMRRARETAEIVNRKLNIPLEFSELLREGKHPTELLGKDRKSDEVVAFNKKRVEHADDRNWHYSDEENYFEFRDRMQAALAMLCRRKEDYILAVTHSNAMRMIMSLVLHGEDLSGQEYFRTVRVLTAENTGITYVRFDEMKERYELVTWNMYVHLNQNIN